GCRFHPRCPGEKSICREQEPSLMPVGDNHWVACHLDGQRGASSSI
ncbi:MAG: peptide ABC transporter substrate-binding protein, partial [Deltaproteobacteria bacterium]|nr:peptide ABC transporter substrate-binding protein [Deltaproteobacteria bacterium]